MLADNQTAFTAAVLAGGRSTRMGADKAFLRVRDELLIERQLRCLRECEPDDLLISGRAQTDYSNLNAKVVYDEYPNAGPLAGLTAVLKVSTWKLILVLAVDMPEMTSAMLLKILSESAENFGCVPADADGYQPLAASYPKAVLPLAEQHMADGQYSMQSFVKEAIAHGLMHPLQIEASERICFTNWNYPSDWDRPSG